MVGLAMGEEKAIEVLTNLSDLGDEIYVFIVIVISTNVETVVGLIYRGCSHLRRLMLIESNHNSVNSRTLQGSRWATASTFANA
jgi:uncharacterized protein YwlG (UPF0340 family)